VLSLIVFGVMLALFGFGLSMLFTAQDPDCSWCRYLNCVNFVSGMCDDDVVEQQ
jgi:hypothetical protein